MSRDRLAPSWAVVGLLLGLAGSARAADPDAAAETGPSRAYHVPGHGTVVLDLPSGWRDSVRQPPQGLPPTIEFAPESGSDFSVLVTPLWKQSGGATTPEEIRKVVEASGTEALNGAVEKELKLQPLDGAEFGGLYYSLTDRRIKEGKRKEGEWRCMAQGSGSLGDLVLTFTILTHSADAPEKDLALAMLKGARRGEATEPAPPAAGSSLRRLTYPGKPWSLVMDLPGFQFDQRESSRDGTGLRVSGSNRETGLIISVYMEKAEKEADAVAVREKSPLAMQDLRLTERGDGAVLEYLVPQAGGVQMDQKHANLYLSHDGVWVDVHLSKVMFDPDQWPLFEAVKPAAAR